MTTLTDYMVLHAGSFEIDSTVASGPPDEKILTFNLPNDFTVGTHLAKPLLAFIVNFRSDDGGCGIWVNPEFPLLASARSETLSWNNATHLDSGLWIAITGTKFKTGSDNRIVFAMQPGDSGHIRFLNVVLWFQRNVK